MHFCNEQHEGYLMACKGQWRQWASMENRNNEIANWHAEHTTCQTDICLLTELWLIRQHFSLKIIPSLTENNATQMQLPAHTEGLHPTIQARNPYVRDTLFCDYE